MTEAAPAPGPLAPPPGLRTVRPSAPGTTRVVLVRHGEAVCNVSGIVGGKTGCSGLTERGRRQAEDLAERLARSGELSEVAAVYASVLPRAIETAEILLPALEKHRAGASLSLETDCSLCELHPGEADALTWAQFSERFAEPDWDREPERALAPGAESWSGFVDRAAAAVAEVADRHPGDLVVVVCHAGVVEATMLRFLPLRPSVARLGLHTEHAAMTIWERFEGRWRLQRFNDATRRSGGAGPRERAEVRAEAGEPGAPRPGAAQQA